MNLSNIVKALFFYSNIQIYDEIAESFSDSRYAPWPGVMSFLSSRPPGAWGADVGCGNGKYSLAVQQAWGTDKQIDILPLLASDSSLRLAETVRARGKTEVIHISNCA